MSTSEVVVVDRAVRNRSSPPDGRGLLTAATDLRRRGSWWAGMVDGASLAGRAEGLRRRDVCVVAADAEGRGVVWIDDVVQVRTADGSAVAGSIVPGCGALWARAAPPDSRRRAWTALRRAHARSLLERRSGLPYPLWRRLGEDDPAAIRRAVREWLRGDEGLAVQVVHSSLAARVARSEAGYRIRETGCYSSSIDT